MFDYTKISFNEMDNDEVPLQFFFNYNLSADELDTFLAYNTTDEDISEDKNVTSLEICVCMFSEYDWKVQLICTLDDNSQEWVDLLDVDECDEFIEIIHNTNTEESEEAYANYEYVRDYGKLAHNPDAEFEI